MCVRLARLAISVPVSCCCWPIPPRHCLAFAGGMRSLGGALFVFTCLVFKLLFAATAAAACTFVYLRWPLGHARAHPPGAAAGSCIWPTSYVAHACLLTPPRTASRFAGLCLGGLPVNLVRCVVALTHTNGDMASCAVHSAMCGAFCLPTSQIGPVWWRKWWWVCSCWQVAVGWWFLLCCSAPCHHDAFRTCAQQ